MYYVYLLLSEKDGRYYIGCTQDIDERLSYHNTGRSIYTKNHVPWALMAYKTFQTRGKAMKEEIRLKKLKNKRAIRQAFGIEFYPDTAGTTVSGSRL